MGANFCTIISKYLTHILLFIGGLIPYSPIITVEGTEAPLRTELPLSNVSFKPFPKNRTLV